MAGQKGEPDDLRIFEDAIPLAPQEKIAAQIKAIDWLSVVPTGWGTVRISIQGGIPALLQWENSIKLA